MALPLPKLVYDVEPGGGLVTSMRGINALQKSNIENKYLPYNKYADALSKIAYSQTSPANALAQFMSGPAAASLSREQTQALATQMQKSLSGPNYMSMLPPPNSGTFGSGLAELAKRGVNYLQDKFMPSSDNSVLAPPTNNPSQEYGAVNQATPEYVQQVSMNGNGSSPLPPASPSKGGRFASQAGALNLPGTQGGNTPSAAAKAQEAGLNTGVTGEVAAQVAQQKAMQDIDNANANEAIDQLNLLDKVENVHKRIPFWQRGVVGGKVPAIESNRQEFDASMAQIVSSITKQQGNGNVTNEGRSLARESKFPADLNDQAFDHLIQYSKGMNERIKEKPAFNKAFADIGKTPEETRILWQYYQSMKPFYDNKKHTVNNDNLRSWDKFYSSQDKINSAFNPSAQKKIESVMGNSAGNTGKSPNNVSWPIGKDAVNEVEVEGQIPPKNTIWMVRPDGMKVPVHNENVDYAIEKYNFRKVG